jgi:DDE family transposase
VVGELYAFCSGTVERLFAKPGWRHGISFLDSTALLVYDNHRIHNHKVLAGLAQRGKGSMGSFYGFKLHLVINECGELLACQITSGNIDDRNPVPILCKRLFGKLIADGGYISQPLFEQILETFGVQLKTKPRRSMKNRLLPLLDKLLLRKRAIIEEERFLPDSEERYNLLEHAANSAD